MQAGVFAEGDLGRCWHKILYEKGWVAPAWPKVYGGTGWTQTQRYIFESECEEVGTPVLAAFGLRMVGPVLMRYGTQQQKDFFLPRILSGEHYWCQGYSEPQAGSDLTALSCRAERDGDDYVLNGNKIWTTHAHNANWIFMLVRTAKTEKPQAGITFLLAPMDLPGITVRPIPSMSGEHEVNQVFFDAVRVPMTNRIGEENNGWGIAKYLLEFERGGTYAPRLKRYLKQVRTIASEEDDGWGHPIGCEPFLEAELAACEVDLIAIDIVERQIVSALSAGQSVGDAAASVLKLQGAELAQRITELGVQMLGPHTLRYVSHERQENSKSLASMPAYRLTTTSRYLNARASTIYGGSSEIQRNILARVWLGL
jgi:alkylation response protein AidB-like acyl-CoA dehydrogenase